jgi:tape measure domain-containing protein
MPTLNAVFKLFDGYSSTIDKVNRKTDEATNKMIRASGQTDRFNDSLKATGTSAGTASSGLNKFVSVAMLVAGAIKGMSITDEFTNTSARLNLINDGSQTQLELQNKIFAAAQRSRGAYADMASAVAKLELNAGDAFGSNNEAVAFTELLQKSFKVGGASQTEQSSGLLQLTQAMAAGKLQGDEFRSIMENAPLVADAIAKFTKKSKGELKEMSSKGEITADIIKASMFAASDEINDRFKRMPMTFADVWNKIKNNATKSFSGVMNSINDSINTTNFDNLIVSITGGIALLASGVAKLLGFIADVSSFFKSNWSVISPIIMGIVTALVIYNAVAAITNTIMGIQTAMASASAAAKMMEAGATFTATAAQYGFNAALMACPLTWIIMLIRRQT